MATIPEALALAIQHHQAGRFQPAEQIYRMILQADPNQPDAIHLLGLLAHQAGRHEAAVESICRAIALDGTVAGFHHSLANVHQDLGRIPESISGYERALALKPDLADAHSNLGLALKAQGKLEEAAACCRRALELNADFPEAHNNLGLVLKQQGMLEEAVAAYRRAVELKPDFAGAYSNLGLAVSEQGKAEEALACLRRAVELNPGVLGAHTNLGNALDDQGRYEEAIACYLRAVELQPDLAEARHNLGMSLLRLGRYEEGWREHEHRLLRFAATRRLSQSRWNGERVEGRTILIQSEQGFGDTLQFVRYVALVRRRSGARRVMLEAPSELARLLTQNSGWDAEIVPRAGSSDISPVAFDCQIPLLSLPLALGVFEPMPMTRSYLRADEELRAQWRERIDPAPSIRVGLVWAGRPEHRADRFRSIRPELFLPLLRMPGFTFYSLQLGPSGRSPTLLEAGLIDLTELIVDFADTAALVEELDLIISVDSAVAHLAGAMGRPVWTLLPFAGEWRWGVSGDATPWYPTMRLFRQPALGDWEAVVRRVALELIRMALT
jgi:tetratricopeptide (TPR) repeat protein